MSVYCSTYVWKTAQEHGTPLLVLLALAEYANEVGECWPGIEALAKKCRITERNAQLILRKLESDDTITTIRHDGQMGNGGKTNRYIINGFVEWDKQVDKVHASKSKVVKTSAQGGENQSSKVVKKDSPDPSVTVKEPSILSAPTNGAVKPSTPVVAKEKKSDPLFDAIGNRLFDAPPGSPMVSIQAGRIAKVKKALVTLAPTITPQNFEDFIVWYNHTYTVELPRDSAKVAFHYSTWLKESVSAPVPVAEPKELTDWEKAEQEAIVTLMNVRAR